MVEVPPAQYLGPVLVPTTRASTCGPRRLPSHPRTRARASHLGLGILYKKTGNLDQARSEISAAIDLYRAMRMASWLSRAEAALADAC